MELKALILALLEPRPLYGYELVQHARTRGELRREEGTLYPLLHRMEAEDLLRAEWRKASGGRERRYYALTRKGKTSPAKARSAWRDHVRVFSGILMGGSHQ
jgi:PadR family transcriptional regulator PadR